MLKPHPFREKIIDFLQALRHQIMMAFEGFEKDVSFKRTKWQHSTGGGGEIGLIRGNCFEKGAVNWSGVWGEKLPLSSNVTPFHATGVSLITHMMNPHAPTVHFNLRFIETPDRVWFGGGYDLTPMGISYHEDTEHFHSVAQSALVRFPGNLYDRFAKNAKQYFYIPHRHRERGVGGLFFDRYLTENFEEDLAMWQSVGHSFLDAILPIYHKRLPMPYTFEQKQLQEVYRAQYVEFNLLYDLGTKFGFESGGNPEAILCSMPPVARW